MADGDGAAPRVELLGRGDELAGPHEGDGGERLVALDGVEVLDGHPRAGEELAGDGIGRRQHEDGILGADGEGLEASSGREVEGLGGGCRGDESGGRPVGHL